MVLSRMPALDDEGRLVRARTALRNTGHHEAIRTELREVVTTFVTKLSPAEIPEPLSEERIETLVHPYDPLTPQVISRGGLPNLSMACVADVLTAAVRMRLMGDQVPGA